MNTLHDLRATLDHHAHDVPDDPSLARVAAVQGRARRVRRRRAGAVVVASVLAVLGVVLVPSLDGRAPQPADRVLAGHEAPIALQSLEYTYGYVRGVEAGSVELSASDEPRLLSWAADADRASLRDPNGHPLQTTRTDFDDFVYVPPGMSGTWTLRAGGGATAFAVYELSGIVPAGSEVGGLFFRNEVAGEVLIDAVAAGSGSPELRFSFAAPEARLRLADHCSGAPEGYWVNVSVDGDGAIAGRSCGDDRFDPGAGGSWFTADQLGVAPGEQVEVRMWVSRRVSGPVADVPGVQLALAAYDAPAPAARVAGMDAPEQYEHEGHTWEFDGATTPPAGRDSLVVTGEDESPTLALVSYDVGRSALVHVRAGGQVTSSQGSGRVPVVLGSGGERATVRVLRGLTPTTLLGAAIYHRVD